jgi:hypothetical protein
MQSTGPYSDTVEEFATSHITATGTTKPPPRSAATASLLSVPSPPLEGLLFVVVWQVDSKGLGTALPVRLSREREGQPVILG